MARKRKEEQIGLFDALTDVERVGRIVLQYCIDTEQSALHEKIKGIVESPEPSENEQNYLYLIYDLAAIYYL